jgi:hypothetical protein
MFTTRRHCRNGRDTQFDAILYLFRYLWAVARQITGELAAEVGVTADDLASTTSVLQSD